MYALLSSANLIPEFIAFDSWYLPQVNPIGFCLFTRSLQDRWPEGFVVEGETGSHRFR